MIPHSTALWLAALLWPVCSLSPCLAEPVLQAPSHQPRVNEPHPTTIIVRVVAHGAMVLGKEVGGARVTITEVASGRILATGLQKGEAGDQNQIMRTPRMMGEPAYTSRPSAFFSATLDLTAPTQVEITAEGPLAYPSAAQRAGTRVWLIPGQDLTQDGIVLTLNGYIVEINAPQPDESLIEREDVMLRASVRTLSGSLVRPHGDWDSRKIQIYGEVLIGDQVIERLQMFYTGRQADFEAPFFVPLFQEAPNGVTVRVVAADPARGNFGVGHTTFPVHRGPSRLDGHTP